MLQRIRRLMAVAVIAGSPLATILVPAVAHAAVDSCTWTGTVDGTFSTGGNWTGCDNSNVPENGDTLIFDVSASANAPTNDQTSMSFDDIIFTGTGGAPITISGNAFTITGDITDNSDQDNSITNDVVFTGTTTVTVPSGQVFYIDGDVSGSGSLIKDGDGGFLLDGAFGLTGAVTDTNGQMTIYADGSDASFSSLTLGANADFFFDLFSLSGAGATYTMTKPVTTAGGTLYIRDYTTTGTPKDVNLTGTYTLTANAFLNAGPAITVHLQGPLQGAGFVLGAAGTGTVINESSSNNTNTPSGNLTSTGGGNGATDDGTGTPTAAPGTPDTGFALVSAHPGVTLAITLASTVGILALARFSRISGARR